MAALSNHSKHVPNHNKHFFIQSALLCLQPNYALSCIYIAFNFWTLDSFQALRLQVQLRILHFGPPSTLPLIELSVFFNLSSTVFIVKMGMHEVGQEKPGVAVGKLHFLLLCPFKFSFLSNIVKFVIMYYYPDICIIDA